MANYIRQRIKSFGFAFKGIFTLVKSEPHAQLHLLATILVVGAGFFFEIEGRDWALLFLAMGLVWAAEAMNTALEALTDKVSPEHHPLAGKAKDVAAGGVLIAALFAVGVAVAVFLPYVKLWCQA